MTRRSVGSVGDWISSEDVADALVTLCGSDTANGAYNIATGRPVGVPEVLEQTPVEVEWVGDDEKADADFDPTLTRGQHAVYDIAAIGRDAGWRPRSFGEQMASYVAWSRTHPEAFSGS